MILNALAAYAVFIKIKKTWTVKFIDVIELIHGDH